MIDSPTNGAKTSGKSETISIANTTDVFNLSKVAAFFGVRAPSPFERAVRLIDVGEFARAEAELSALLATEDSGDRASIFNKRGVARVHQGRHAEGLSDFNAALEIHPAFAPALVNIGNLLLEGGQVEAAVVQYEAALRSDDGHRAAHFNLGVAFKKLGRHADAVREFRRADRIRRK